MAFLGWSVASVLLLPRSGFRALCLVLFGVLLFPFLVGLLSGSCLAWWFLAVPPSLPGCGFVLAPVPFPRLGSPALVSPPFGWFSLGSLGNSPRSPNPGLLWPLSGCASRGTLVDYPLGSSCLSGYFGSLPFGVTGAFTLRGNLVLYPPG